MLSSCWGYFSALKALPAFSHLSGHGLTPKVRLVTHPLRLSTKRSPSPVQGLHSYTTDTAIMNNHHDKVSSAEDLETVLSLPETQLLHVMKSLSVVQAGSEPLLPTDLQL